MHRYFPTDVKERKAAESIPNKFEKESGYFLCNVE
jgi:hypothetical protein